MSSLPLARRQPTQIEDAAAAAALAKDRFLAMLAHELARRSRPRSSALPSCSRTSAVSIPPLARLTQPATKYDQTFAIKKSHCDEWRRIRSMFGARFPLTLI